nr:apyrase-like [Onthophagus taurus]
MIFFKLILTQILIHLAFGDVNFTILHINDLHAHFDELNEGGKVFGGVSRISHLVNEFRKDADLKKSPPVFFLIAGDVFFGTVWFSLRRWKIVSDYVNLLEPDAMCLGNHEFDDSLKNLTKFIKSSNYPCLSCNTDFVTEPELNNLVKPSITFKIGSFKIGIIGVLTTDTLQAANCEGTVINDEIESIKTEAQQLKESGVNVIVVLSHVGYEDDLKIAEEIEDVDIVVGGHTDTFLWTGKQPDLESPVDDYPKEVIQKSGKTVLVVQAYAYGKYLGVLNLTFSDNGNLLNYSGNPILLSENFPKNLNIEKLVKTHRKEIEKETKTVIGESKTHLSRHSCRYTECYLGNLLTNSFIDYINDEEPNLPYWANCSIAFANSGSIRKSIDIGNVTVDDVFQAFPYFGPLVTVEITGETLLKVLEVSVSENADENYFNGRFLQLSGLTVTYDRSKNVGNRILRVQVRCQKCEAPQYEPIRLNENYRIITTSFLSTGGDGQQDLNKNKKNLQRYDIADTTSVVRYFRKYKIIDLEVEEQIEMKKYESCGLRIILDEKLFFVCLFFIIKD